MSKFKYTDGLQVTDSRCGSAGKALIKICFERVSQDLVDASVESARTLGAMPRFGKVELINARYAELRQLDGMDFNRAAFALFGLSI